MQSELQRLFSIEYDGREIMYGDLEKCKEKVVMDCVKTL
jgi:hypothetical protein